ncbi:MAG: class I SAM-dependent methyltransferase [Thermodesulfobacteriota bacterium]
MQDDRLTRLFFDIFNDLPRQGPGDAQSTARALGLCAGLPPRPDILDVGCGSGVQTLELARRTGGRVTGVDTHPVFLERLAASARSQGLGDRVRAVRADMKALPFPGASFDLVWSEGAIYNMGFDSGLRAWRKLLRPGGCLAVTDAVWLRPDPPRPCREFWDAECPDIRGVEANLAAAEAAGYQTLGWFILPERCWRDEYYAPLGLRLESFRAEHASDPEALGLADALQAEIDLYESHSAWYGYAFLAMRRKD